MIIFSHILRGYFYAYFKQKISEIVSSSCFLVFVSKHFLSSVSIPVEERESFPSLKTLAVQSYTKLLQEEARENKSCYLDKLLGMGDADVIDLIFSQPYNFPEGEPTPGFEKLFSYAQFLRISSDKGLSYFLRFVIGNADNPIKIKILQITDIDFPRWISYPVPQRLNDLEELRIRDSFLPSVFFL